MESVLELERELELELELEPTLEVVVELGTVRAGIVPFAPDDDDDDAAGRGEGEQGTGKELVMGLEMESDLAVVIGQGMELAWTGGTSSGLVPCREVVTGT